jgi:hypothetical protein
MKFGLICGEGLEKAIHGGHRKNELLCNMSQAHASLW